MSRTRYSVPRSKFRSIITEMLPFELPVAFDNLSFFVFLESVRFRWDERYYFFRREHEGVILALRIIFGKGAAITLQGDEYRVPKPYKAGSIPWQYAIRTRSGRDRVLSIPHPAAQLAIAELYASQSSLILHHAARGSYSLRVPDAVARYTTVRDSILGPEEASRDSALPLELRGKEDRYLRSFFVYKNVSALHQFYDSAEYHEAEKSFQFLTRVDLTRCFDSIYTHSIAWAVHERESVKRDIDGHGGTFANEFDRVMRWANDNETNGIIIGPEVSRIFAELILQGVDRSVENRLLSMDLVNGRDYRVLRYVDDYFIFSTDGAVRDRVQRALEEELRPFRMSINSAKTEEMEAPFISPMTAAKDTIASLVDEVFARSGGSGDVDPERVRRRLVNGIKKCLLETQLAASDVSNFAAAVLERHLEDRLSADITRADVRSGSDAPTDSSEQGVSSVESLMALSVACLSTQAYLLGVAPLVTVAFKYARTAALLQRRLPQLGADERLLNVLHETVSRETRRLIGQLRRRGGVEWLWLLETLGDLPQRFELSADEFDDFLKEVAAEGDAAAEGLALISLMRAAGPRLALRDVRSRLESRAISRIEQLLSSGRPSAEGALLALNFVASPYVGRRTKLKLARFFFPGSNNTAVAQFESAHPHWFARPMLGGLYEELRTKRVHEVY